MTFSDKLLTSCIVAAGLLFTCVSSLATTTTPTIKKCSFLPEVEFGDVVNSNGTKIFLNKTSNETFEALEGESIYLKCWPAMTLKGDEASACADKDKWWPPLGFCVINLEEAVWHLLAAVHKDDLKTVRQLLEIQVQNPTDLAYLVEFKFSNGRTLLSEAANSGSLQVLSYLADHFNASVYVRDNAKGSLPIHLAAEAGNVDAVAFLASYANETLTAINNANNTALCVAITSKRYRVVEFLVRNTTQSVEKRCEQNRTPLMQAAMLGYVDVVRVLVEVGNASVKATDNDRNGFSAIHYATEYGRLAVVRYLTQTRPEITDAGTFLNDSALNRAALKQQLDIVEFLCLNASADVEHRGNMGRTPLLSAVSVSNAPIDSLLAVVKILIDKCNASVVAKDYERGSMAIHLAAEFNKLPVVAFLLDRFPQLIDAKNDQNETALCRAAQTGQLDVVVFLVQNRSANVEQKCYLDRTPLLYAASTGQLNVVQYLLENASAAINATDSPRGNLAIHLAATFGKLDVVSYLIYFDLELTEARNAINDTALNTAASGGQIEIMRYLIANESADLENRGYLGTTPLLRAAGNGRLRAVQFLAENGANILATAGSELDGDTALHLAVAYNHTPVVRYLRNRFPELLPIPNMLNLTALDMAKATNKTETIHIIQQPRLPNVSVRRPVQNNGTDL